MNQLCLFENEENVYKLPSKKVRERYDVPTYLKFYSLFQYDRQKFRELMNDWLKTEEGQNRTYKTLTQKQKEVLELCYIRDKNGKPLRDSDEKCILSEKRLQKYHEKIYETLMAKGLINVLRIQDRIAQAYITPRSYELGILTVHPDDMQAEITGTWNFPLKDRILLHYKLLKRLEGNR